MAVNPNYKTGRPSDGTAGILRLTTDKGTVLVPAEVVDRRRLFAFGPLVATPGALRALVAEGADPAPAATAPPARATWGTLSADRPRRQRRGQCANGDHILSAYDLGDHPPVDHHQRRDRRPRRLLRAARPLRHHSAASPSEY